MLTNEQISKLACEMAACVKDVMEHPELLIKSAEPPATTQPAAPPATTQPAGKGFLNTIKEFVDANPELAAALATALAAGGLSGLGSAASGGNVMRDVLIGLVLGGLGGGLGYTGYKLLTDDKYKTDMVKKITDTAMPQFAGVGNTADVLSRGVANALQSETAKDLTSLPLIGAGAGALGTAAYGLRTRQDAHNRVINDSQLQQLRNYVATGHADTPGTGVFNPTKLHQDLAESQLSNKLTNTNLYRHIDASKRLMLHNMLQQRAQGGATPNAAQLLNDFNTQAATYVNPTNRTLGFGTNVIPVPSPKTFESVRSLLSTARPPIEFTNTNMPQMPTRKQVLLKSIYNPRPIAPGEARTLRSRASGVVRSGLGRGALWGLGGGLVAKGLGSVFGAAGQPKGNEEPKP